MAKAKKHQAPVAPPVDPFIKMLDNEIIFGKTLWKRFGIDVLGGDTTSETRKQRFRETINKLSIADSVIRTSDGKATTYGTVFMKIYGEEL